MKTYPFTLWMLCALNKQNAYSTWPYASTEFYVLRYLERKYEQSRAMFVKPYIVT